MKDPRYDKLADVLIRHSTRLQTGEKLLIEAIDIPAEMVVALIRRARKAGGQVFTTVKQNTLLRELYCQESETAMQLAGKWEAERMAEMDAYIALRGSHNITELADVPDAGMKLYQQHWWKPVHLDIRVSRTKWVVLRWPHPSMAQQAMMSTEAFEDFYFDVCTLDYGRMSGAMDALVQRIDRADKVEIQGPGTNLSFSIAGMTSVKCAGERNIPDGEVYTAPVRDSVEGELTYTARTIYQGVVHENIHLVFKKGRIVEATSSKSDELVAVLDTDPGARYIGEFALGLNPYITEPMLDILFDEKIAGSFHFTPGEAYEKADNGNRSQVHWDMVCIQTPEYGGGEIRFDGELIRKDGRFVPKELQALNPENLK
ncbi:aminopeptidase [candidate division KSB1 bacterium]|nr:aminopeptidase [candidate division KSB1 bacterium]